MAHINHSDYRPSIWTRVKVGVFTFIVTCIVIALFYIAIGLIVIQFK